MRKLLFAIIGVVCLLGLATDRAVAHEIRPLVASIDFAANGRYAVIININLEALLAGIGPQHKDSNDSPNAATYNQLRALPPAELLARFDTIRPRWLSGLELDFDGHRATPRITSVVVPEIGDTNIFRISELRLDGDTPAGARTFRWRYDPELGSSVLRVTHKGATEIFVRWLPEGRTSDPISLAGVAPRSTADVFRGYLALGFTHILPYGIDHILFVLGLYLLSTSWRPLVIQVTAFTFAHSITLGLGLYGIVEASPKIVEPLIAASIVYVAVENIVTNKLHTWRPLVVFGFGLLHGLGFAGVLQEIGLPRADYVTGLIAFNTGVEFGQLAVIALAFAATGLWFRTRPWYRARIVIPASAAIAAVGLFWTVERVVAG